MMFKRKGPGDEGGKDTSPGTVEFSEDAATGRQRARPSPEGVNAARAPTPSFVKPGPVPAPARRVTDIPNMSPRGEHPAMPAESKKLIVGRDISLTGKIASCDRLIVEGRVEAELENCHTVEIAGAGTFKGAAEIEEAEVSGRYEGSLTVRGHLLIRGTGQVSGTIRYGRLQIEAGGEINGDVRSMAAKAESVKSEGAKPDVAKPEKPPRPEIVSSSPPSPSLPGIRAAGED